MFKNIFEKWGSRRKRHRKGHKRYSGKHLKKDDELLQVDPEDDVWIVEEGGHSEGRKYARKVVQSFYPILYVSSVLGLFPLVPERQKDGTYIVKFSWTSYATILFMISFLGVICTTFWILMSLISISINSPHQPDTPEKAADIARSEEVFVYKRNILTLVILIGHYIHMTICMISVFLRRDFIAKQFVYWTEVVELLQLDVSKHVAIKLSLSLLFLFIFVVGMIVMYALNYSPMLSASGSTFYMVIMRVIDPQSMWHPNIKVMKHIFAFFLLYVLIATKLYILWFSYNCRILHNILTVWNHRFQFCLHDREMMDAEDLLEAQAHDDLRFSYRTSRAQMFQDHLVIFNLLEGVNTQFEVIMESFYLNTMVMIVFEAYGFVHAFFYKEFQDCGARQHDLVPILLLLSMQLFVYVRVTLGAAGVADEARHVLDIVRRKGMMSSKVDNEVWFMLSMRLSFGGHQDVGIIGAGFFYVTKAFLLGAISAMTSHFIIFYQFEIPLGQTEEADANFKNIQTKYILAHLEGVSGTSC